MNIFNKIALQSLKKNRTRTAVTMVGVALSAAMITAAATFGVSLLNYMADGAVLKYGNWHAAFLDVDSSFVQERMQDREVTNTAVFENIGYAVFDGAKNPARPYLFIAGFNRETFDTLPVTLLSGRLPETDGEILVPGRIAADGGVSPAVGDTVSLTVGSRVGGTGKLGQNDPYTPGTEIFVPQGTRTYTVTGTCQTPVFEGDSAAGYTVITRADAAEAADTAGKADVADAAGKADAADAAGKTAAADMPDAADAAGDFTMFAALKNPRRIHFWLDSVSAGHAYILNHNVLRLLGISDDPSDKIFNAFLYSAGGIVIAIIMTGSVFLIYNSFSISLNERIQQIGILASVGATARQLKNSVLFEGLCIGAVGIPAGVLAGLGSIWLVISVVAGNFGSVLYVDVPMTVKVSVPAIAAAAAVSVVTILISACIPADKALRMPIMECIRQTNEIKAEPGAMKTSKLAQRIYGLEGILALKNFKRNRKRYRSIVLSLVLSIVLFVSTSTLVTDLKQISEQARVVTDYDIGFGTQDMEDGEMLQLYDRLKTVDGITGSSFQALLNYSCAVRADSLSDSCLSSAGGYPSDGMVNLQVGIQFLDGGAYLKIIRDLGLPVEEYAGQNGKLIAVAKMEDHSGQAEGVRQLQDMFTKSSMSISVTPDTGGGRKEGQGQNIDITFVETIPPDIPPAMGAAREQPYIFQVLAPWSLKEMLSPPGSSFNMKVKGMTFRSENPSQSAAQMKTVIQDAGITSAYILLNTSQALEESRNYVFIANVFAYTFIIMISLIAVANVFNTVSTNIRLRRKELAMLRSVGMSDRDFNKMMRFECMFYGVRALFIGLPTAAAISWLVHRGMVTDDIKFVLPWASIGISVISVLLVIFVTMRYAVDKIKKENIIDALRDDIT